MVTKLRNKQNQWTATAARCFGRYPAKVETLCSLKAHGETIPEEAAIEGKFRGDARGVPDNQQATADWRGGFVLGTTRDLTRAKTRVSAPN